MATVERLQASSAEQGSSSIGSQAMAFFQQIEQYLVQYHPVPFAREEIYRNLEKFPDLLKRIPHLQRVHEDQDVHHLAQAEPRQRLNENDPEEDLKVKCQFLIAALSTKPWQDLMVIMGLSGNPVSCLENLAQ